MKTKILNVGIRCRSAEFDASKADKEKRIIPIVWSTGERVLTWHPDIGQFYEELGMDPDSCDMSRMDAGKVPLLKDHDKYTIDSVLGTIQDSELVDGIGKGNARFSQRAEVDSVYQDVLDKVITSVSAGYRVRKYQFIEDADDGFPVYRAVKWQPFEVSMVAVGAEVGAGTRSASEELSPCEIVERAESANKGDTMPPEIENTTASPAAATAPTDNTAGVEAARMEATKNERTRVSEITLAVRTAGLDNAFGEKLVADGVSADSARKLIIEEWSKRGPAPAVSVQTGAQDETETRRRSIESAILHRFDPKFKAEMNARDYMSASLMDLSRELLEARGERVKGLSKTEIATRAITTSDLPNIVANVAFKTLRDGYQSAPQVFRPFTREVELPDFKPVSRVQMGDAPALEVVGEDGSVKRGMVSDGAESYALGEYAKIVAITRKTIINDDMGAITRVPMLMGRAAADLESDLIFSGSKSLFGANSAAGQTLLTDNKAVFHSGHGNLAGSGAVISVTSIGAGRSAMRQQKNLQGRPISVYPKFILVPTALETVADQFVSSAMLANQASTVNPFASKLQVLAEPRLDALSPVSWYLLADFGQIDICEIAYLQGQKGVYFETKQGFEVEGMEFKARLDVAVKFIDYRGAYKNPGA